MQCTREREIDLATDGSRVDVRSEDSAFLCGLHCRNLQLARVKREPPTAERHCVDLADYLSKSHALLKKGRRTVFDDGRGSGNRIGIYINHKQAVDQALQHSIHACSHDFLARAQQVVDRRRGEFCVRCNAVNSDFGNRQLGEQRHRAIEDCIASFGFVAFSQSPDGVDRNRF